MIIITGAVVARPDTIDELRALSLEHVHRSRLEPGCLSHAVHIDAENPLRLVFFETWRDRAAVAAHFAVPESGAFVRAAAKLAAEQTTIQLYEAEPLTQS
jgi:quinol monooxygenase YgiN